MVAAIVGRRVLLRHPVDQDCAEFVRLVRRSRALHRPWVYPPADRPRFMAYVRRARSARHAGFLVCRRDDGGRGGVIVGVVNLNEIIRGGLQGAFVGYYAFAGQTGQGYMTEGLALALRHAFRTLKLHRVEANIQPRNARSIALAKRCGFRREGVSPRYLKIGGRWRDHERWALRADGWVAGRRARHGRSG
ncbi:MAG TPA: GNAT family protein [Methylomirabilota bacterium]|jgi:ribosomal-protein-alanine N-acetyltransferase|nr:GNAT family protein [Methylomirabilota bacterium]